MADLTYSAELKDGISPGLKKIQSELSSTQTAFSRFQGVLSGLAVGAFIANAVKMADAISDTATAAGISTQALLGFTNAVAANGGTVDGASQGILKFNQSIAEAANGSRETQAAFAKVGVTLSDLRTLSEEDLMRKTVEGLGKTSDASLRASLGMNLFGKAARGTDFVGVANDIDSLTEAQRNNAAAVESAGKVSDSLSASYRDLQLQILNALKPLADLITVLLQNKAAIQSVVETVINLGIALASLFAVNKLVSVFASFTNELSKNGSVLKSLMGMIGGGAALATAQQGVRNLKIEWMELGNVFNSTGKGVEATSGPLSKLMSFLGGVGAAFVRLLPLIGQIVSAFFILDGVIKLITGNSIVAWADKAGKAISDLLGISYKTSEQKDKEAAAIAKATEEQEKQKAAAQGTRDVVDTIGVAYKALVADLQKGVDAYMRSNEEVIKRLKLDGELIGLTEQQKAVKQALYDVESKNQTELIRLQELYKEKSTSSKEEDLRLLPDIEKAMEKVRGSLEGQKKAVEELVVANAARVEQENQLKALADYTSSIQIDNAKKLRDLQHEMATSTMSEIQKKYADIAYAADESARAEIQKENTRRKQLGLIAMTADEEAKYYAAAKQGIDKLGEAYKKNYEQSRTWSSGWNKAWRDYADDATNAAKTAESIFKKTTQGIEDAIVNAAKTGKWEFKDMLNSIGEEILRSGIRKGITGLFEGLSSGGDGLLGSIGKMFGLEGVFGGASGAGKGGSSNDPLYVYDVAGGGGGRGPMSGGGGGGGGQTGGGWWDTVTDTVSTVWDGITGAASSVWDTVTTGITDIFGGGGGGGTDWLSGITDFFGGFFANGGTLGAGKWGIAGENGPEMISGPATITPMGGSSNVTYNINAVDAASFKAMIAADPSFIHAVAQQGGRGVPRRY